MSAAAKPFDLEASLRARGLWNADGIRRAARARHHSCGVVVLAGLDADVCGLPAAVDPYLLDAAGELAALIAGRATYRLVPTGAGYELDTRDQFHLAGHHPGGSDERGQAVVVLAEHRCGTRLSNTPLAAYSPVATQLEEPDF